ncbi:glycosyltransferase [Pseudohoeflea coraliihabitans]|uniref:Uncharacterized protein n=1 Tax=Pseudohoeflea coraliihabitans TaxID=2860393 RepID=A0ABS6WIU2_9HYPH|nr:glycosyltransferase [Pseudohoeflea sp. DP4N28-3]MBW3095857.1 hypothetical protein [Pseudohoeflea sp. DP4N28-3]
MIFTYWTHPLKDAPDSEKEWKTLTSAFRSFGDEDVLPLLDQHRAGLQDLFQRISLPACKSDIARLALLYQFGGLYVDAHAAPTTGGPLIRTLGRLARLECVLFGKSVEDNTHRIDLVNSAICARSRSPIIGKALNLILDNLYAHFEREQETSEYIPYNLAVVSGAWPIGTVVLDRSRKPFVVKDELRDRVDILHLSEQSDHGFRLYRHYKYRGKGQHWRELQNHNRLFIDK